MKLIFNVTHYYPHRAEAFSTSIPHILKILTRIHITTTPLQPPVNYLINSLVNLDLEDKKFKSKLSTNPLFPKFDQNCNVDKFINILDSSITRYTPLELERDAIPVLSLLKKIYGFAPQGVKNYMRWLLLPEEDDRDQPIGQSDTLSSRLLRLSTSPVAPNLREGISALMFELSGNDAEEFVQNIGYGFAAGFLMTHNMPMPESASQAYSTAGDGTQGPINPITGQRFASEPQDHGPPMTQEEKEMEAERLFVLFDRCALQHCYHKTKERLLIP